MVDGGGLQELAALPPGPVLAARLAALDPCTVPNDDIVDLLVARSRQLAHDQALLWLVMSEVLHRRPFAGPGEVQRSDAPDPYGADEVRAALSWTRRAAEGETDLALVLVGRLPLVQHALLTGLIDRGKAVVFARHLPDLTPEQIAVICAALLPLAPGLTTGQLQDRIKRMILEIDPDYYDARYRKALRERRLVHYLDADGAAVVTAAGLPADEAAAAMQRVDDLARAARRAGHPGTLDQIRTDVFLMLLDGSVQGMTRNEIIDALFGRHAGHADGAPPDGGAEDGIRGGDPAQTATRPTGAAPAVRDRQDPGCASASGDGASGDGASGDGAFADGGPGSGDPAGAASDSPSPDRDASESPGSTGGSAHEAATHEAATHEAATHEAATHEAATHEAGAEETGPDQRRTPTDRPGEGAGDHRVGIEIRVPLLTLLGLTERAGELPGLGPVTAPTARRAVARARRAQWRWAVVGADGRLLTEGLIRYRPADLDRNGPHGGIVELQVSDTDLARAAADPSACGTWAALVADIAGQHRRHLDPRHRTDLDAHPGGRFPRAALRRHVQIRDRTCCHPGCRAPASTTDIDHTVDHAHGGPTVHDDLGPACRHDHTLKTTGGWTCHQPEPGRFVWTSPLGRCYEVRPEPILPPPLTATPRAPDPWHDQPADDTDRPLVAEPGPARAPPREDPARDEPRRHRGHVLDPFTLDAGSASGEADPPPF